MNDVPKILGLASLLLASGIAMAEGRFYRWTDKDGHVHYSDQPAANAVEVTPKSPAGTAVAVPPPVAASSSSSSSPRASAAPASAAAATAAPVSDCDRKKDQLNSFRNAGKITETNNLGETHEYSDEQRQKLIDTAEQAVRDACAGT